MFKALLKKQFLELNTFYFQNKKTGELRSKAGAVAMAALFVALFAFLMGVFFYLSGIVGAPLIDGGLDWAYFAIMGVLSLFMGVFGTVFNTYAGLFKAKDNDMLLAMPIPSWAIVVVRMLGVVAMSVLYSEIVWVPAVLFYAVYLGPSAESVIAGVILALLVPLLVAAVSCAVGMLVALISGHARNKSAMTIAASLVFFVAYYALCFQFVDLFESMAANGQAVGNALRLWAFPVYLLGSGACGSVGGILGFAVVALAAFGLCCWVMSRNFARIAVMGIATRSVEGRVQEARVSSVAAALFHREFKRFASSPTYVLNCAMGSVFMVMFVGATLLRMGDIQEIVCELAQELPDLASFVPVVLTAAVLFLVAMGCVTAPSVSMDGRTHYVLRAMPVATRQILQAKLGFGIVMGAVPALVCVVAVGAMVGIELQVVCGTAAAVLAFVCFHMALGLVLGLLHANIDWTDETVAVKRSPAVLLSILVGAVLSVAFVAAFYFCRQVLSPVVYCYLWAAVLAAATFGLVRWLGTKGVECFESL